MDNFSQEEKNESEHPARGKGACVGGRRGSSAAWLGMMETERKRRGG